MAHGLPAVVFDTGTSTTRAGFALEDLPLLVVPSAYQQAPEGARFGDAMDPQLEVMTLVDNGLVYNHDHVPQFWQSLYARLDAGNGADATEHPLMVTEPTWNVPKNKAAMAQIAFETLQVPLFSLVKTPLAQLYHMGRLSGLVVDVGAGVASVTPILDGVIQHKLAFHSRYAGDFANVHVLGALTEKARFSHLLPPLLAGAHSTYQHFYALHHVLHSFKETMLSVQEPPPGMAGNFYPGARPQHPELFQLPLGQHVPYLEHELGTLLEPLFVPNSSKAVLVPEPVFDKASTHGVLNLVLYALKNLEQLYLALADARGSGNTRFNEVLRLLFTNTLITGGTSLATGFAQRLCGDIQRLAPQVLPAYQITTQYKLYIQPLRNHGMGDILDTFDKRFGLWLGAANLALMLNDVVEDDGASVNIAMENWFVLKSDYAELGEDWVLEKFK